MLIKSFIGHTNAVARVAFSPDGTCVLTGSYDKTARLWDVVSGVVLRTFTGHISYVNSVAYSAGGHTVLTASGDGTARLWDISSIGIIYHQQLYTAKIPSITISAPNNRHLFCSSALPFSSADLTIYNLIGKAIAHIRINQILPGKTTITLKNPLPAGYFLFRIVSPRDKKLFASGGFLVM